VEGSVVLLQMVVQEVLVEAVELLLLVKLAVQEQAVKEIVVALLLMFLRIEVAAVGGQALRV
jgi:hypothetical protein